jgi:Na+-transporting NADH:ubiquinone oxidoreductase subunit NqrB
MGDPRGAQIAVLSGLIAWGSLALEFGFGWERALVTIGSALAVQALGNRWRGESFEPRSALISALSLILLLRSADIGFCAAAAMIAVGSKFVIRARGRHVFNPTNIAIVSLLLTTDAVWVSSGQWGSEALAVATLVAAACWVLPRVRGDVTIAFVATWCALLFGRAWWLGDPLAIPLHQLSSGTLFVFAAFMLSDPRTIPNARAGRIVFAVGIALAGYVGRFVFFEPDALLFSLAGAALFVPWLDRWLPGSEFRWPSSSHTSTRSRERKENIDGSPHPEPA